MEGASRLTGRSDRDQGRRVPKVQARKAAPAASGPPPAGAGLRAARPRITSGPALRILVTGKRGAGKTTVCEKAAAILKDAGLRCGGVLTEKIVDQEGKIAGLRVRDLADPRREWVLARTDRPWDGPCVGPYRFSREALRMGREALERAVAESEVVLADELGHLELRGEGFSNLLPLLLSEAPLPVIAVVRTELLAEVRDRMGKAAPLVLRVAAPGRDQMPERLARAVLDRLYASVSPPKRGRPE
ncbi:MAG: nucleoside-triphosphatase [bacterium]